MKINRLTRFPYPVLEEATDDYKEGKFSVDIEIAESIRTGSLLIRYEVHLIEATLSEYLSEGSAKVVMFITCLESYYNQLHTISGTNGHVEIGEGLLHGNVRMLPLIVLVDPGKEVKSDNFHEDYEEQGFHLEDGAILAIGEEFQINVGREKLAPIESIFNLAINNSVPPGQFSVNLDEEKIAILAEEQTYRSIYDIRNTATGRKIILNSVYFPALMEVLSVLQLESGPYQDKRWFRVFEAKCIHEGINLESTELLRNAQRLLKTPFNRVVDFMQELE